nr:MAG TPA: nucelotide kinase [Bacteriophage sp.]
MLESEAFKGQKIKVKSGSFKDKRGYIVWLGTGFAYVWLDDDEKKCISVCLEYEQLEPVNETVSKHPYLGGLCEVTLPTPKYYDEHYASMSGLEPIELMQLVLSLPEFVGFLKGNIIKYTLRAGKKQGEAAEKDVAKAKRYTEWLMKLGYKMPINPKED